MCVVFVFLFFYIWLLTSKSEVEFVFNKNDLKNLMKILYVLVPKSDSFWERRSYPIDFATFIFQTLRNIFNNTFNLCMYL